MLRAQGERRELFGRSPVLKGEDPGEGILGMGEIR